MAEIIPFPQARRKALDEAAAFIDLDWSNTSARGNRYRTYEDATVTIFPIAPCPAPLELRLNHEHDQFVWATPKAEAEPAQTMHGEERAFLDDLEAPPI
jgi:hypothetical protein